MSVVGLYLGLLGVGVEVLVVVFFQAEDGIRDGHVTGVQTCALPILEPAIFIDLESRGAGQQLPFSAGPRRATRTSSTCRSLVVTTSTPVATWASLANRYRSVVAVSGTLVMATPPARAILPTNRQELS